MSVITTLNDWITGASFRWQVNTNFANLNTDKVETSTYTSGLATKQDTLVSWTNIKTINGSSVLGSGDLTVSGGASTFLALTDTPSSYTGQALKIAQVNAGETALEFITLVGGGNALTSNPLSQFASTTSAQLAGVMSDETGTGALVFANSPTLVTPVLGAATATSINGATITSGTLNGSVTGTNTGDQTSIVWITGTKAQFDTAVTDGNIVYSGDSPTLGTITTTGNIELGNASDTTISRSSAWTLAVEGVRVRTTTPLVVSATSYTTNTGTSLNMDNLDMFVITAQAGALLFNAPWGTLVQGRQLIIRINDNGTARALTWNAVFRAMGTALPSTTVLSKTLYLGFMYNSTDTKWDLIASAQEA